MTRFASLGRRAALLLSLLALLAVGTLGQVPAAGATSPWIWIAQLDAHTIQIHGSGFTPGGEAGYAIRYDNTGYATYGPWTRSATIAVSPYSFWCDRSRCSSAGGTFTATGYVYCGYVQVVAADYNTGQYSNTVTLRTC